MEVGKTEIVMKTGMCTGSCDMMDWNCSGLKRPESRRNSSSVRMVLQERFAAAGSMPIVFGR